MKRISLILIFIFTTSALSAQKVGLVLSGGGAKGLYHVGMIKALEENGIPIDYVSGASMGAIVGAMYVSGYSPDEMLSFFATDSVKTWLAGKIPDEYRYYFTKFSPTPEIISVKINPDTVKLLNILALPSNIVSPYRIDLAFNKMIMPASSAAGEDFDKLMVPFRCDASDVYNKKTVIFKSGNLAFAVRASMTIPAVFKPMVYDTLLLYDGGLYNNFPWQTLKEDFDPDILIGGICAGNYKNPINSDIVGQLSVMMTTDTDYTLPDSTDIIIQRHFTEVEVLDYQKATYIMACGYEDAMRQMPKILKKIKRRVSPEEIAEKRRAFKQKIRPLIYEKVEIEGLSPEQTDYIYRQLDVRGEKYLMSAEAFEERYMRILASDIFTGDFPQVTFNPETGYYRIKVKMHTQPSVKISLGGNLSPTSLNMMYLGLQYRTVTNAAMTYGLNAYLGTYYNSVDVGIRHDIFTRFPFFIEYFLGYESTDNDTKIAAAYYENQSWRSINHYNYFVGGKLAVPLFSNSAARFNVSLGQMSDTYYPTYHTSQDDPCKSEFWYGVLSVEAQSQSFNFSIHPTAGKSHLLQLQFRAGIENYTPGTLSARETIRRHNRSWFMARYAIEKYLPLGKTFTLGYMSDLTVSNHPNFSDRIATAITQPAFTPTPLSQVLFMPEYRSASYLAAGIMPIINFSQDKKFYLKSFLYGFLPQEFVYDNGWQSLTGKRLSDYYMLIFGTTLVYQTIIGPASLNVTKFTTGPKNWNVVLNMGFNLFSTRRY